MELIDLSEEQQLFLSESAKFVENELRPHALEWEKQGRTPRKVWERCGELGYLGIKYPEEVGGQGCDYIYAFLWAQEMGKCGTLGCAMGLSVQSDMATPALARHGNDFLKKEYLRPAIQGKKICSIGVTEPGCGSDVAALKTTAVKKGGDYIINGRKTFITNGMQADFVTLLARTSDEPGHRSFSLFVVPTDTRGFSRGRDLDKTCFPSSDTAELFLDDVKISANHLIGKEGEGFVYQMQQFQMERLIGVAISLGCLQRAYTLTKQYVQERSVFGRSLSKFQVTQHKMAQMLSEITMLECMSYQCVRKVDEGKDITKAVSMLKLVSAQILQRVLEECVQLFGGYGLMTEYEVSRYFRDAKLWGIGAGTNEVMKEIIAKKEGFS